MMMSKAVASGRQLSTPHLPRTEPSDAFVTSLDRRER